MLSELTEREEKKEKHRGESFMFLNRTCCNVFLKQDMLERVGVCDMYKRMCCVPVQKMS